MLLNVLQWSKGYYDEGFLQGFDKVPIREFPKIRVSYFGVLVIRIPLLGVLH